MSLQEFDVTEISCRDRCSIRDRGVMLTANHSFWSAIDGAKSVQETS